MVQEEAGEKEICIPEQDSKQGHQRAVQETGPDKVSGVIVSPAPLQTAVYEIMIIDVTVCRAMGWPGVITAGMPR